MDFVKDSRVLLCVELYLDFMNSPFTTGQRYVGSLGNQHDDGKQDILLKILSVNLFARNSYPTNVVRVFDEDKTHQESEKGCRCYHSLNKSQEFHQVKNLSL